jgi:hypothetical protein
MKKRLTRVFLCAKIWVQKQMEVQKLRAVDIANKANCSVGRVYQLARELGRLPTVEELNQRKNKRGRPPIYYEFSQKENKEK